MPIILPMEESPAPSYNEVMRDEAIIIFMCVLYQMIRRLKLLLTRERIAYTEYTFSSRIGLSDLKVEPFTVS